MSVVWVIVMYLKSPLTGEVSTISFEHLGRYYDKYTCEAERIANDHISDARGNWRGPTACIPVIR